MSAGDTTTWRLCVAPMMDWTDRHCRRFHRLLSPNARLYTDMVTTGALLHGDVERHLAFSAQEHPVALQLGGSDPDELARCARLGESWGYDEINLNCGCPSERVQRGSFGVCLMADPGLVGDCVGAMREAVCIPVTVKHRIGIDRNEDFAFVHGFVARTFDAGCRVFIVHARNAWLKGLSPKENREVPPLRHDVVRRLKMEFPGAQFVLNGGLTRADQVSDALQGVDGIMLGRAAYQDPFLLVALERQLFGDSAGLLSEPFDAIERMSAYLEEQLAAGVPAWSVARHMLGLFQGCRGARAWRRNLSDPHFVARHGANVLREAAQEFAVDLLVVSD